MNEAAVGRTRMGGLSLLAGIGSKNLEANQRPAQGRSTKCVRGNRKTRTTPRKSLRLLESSYRRYQSPRLSHTGRQFVHTRMQRTLLSIGKAGNAVYRLCLNNNIRRNAEQGRSEVMYLRICPVRIWSICLFRLWVAAPVVHLVERHGFVADAVVIMLVCYEFPVLNIIFD